MGHTLRLLTTIIIASATLCACIIAEGGSGASDAGHDASIQDADTRYTGCNEAGVCRDTSVPDACDEVGICGDAGEPEACNEAGVCDWGQGGNDWGQEGYDWGEHLTFSTVIITDTTAAENENMNGTPGVDICSVSSTCGTAIGAELNPGTGDLCEVAGPDCQLSRTLPAAALSVEAQCEADSGPISDFVTLGMDGQLTVFFDADQAGCTVYIDEHEGVDLELYSVWVCTEDPDMPACLVGADGSIDLLAEVSGPHEVAVPTIE